MNYQEMKDELWRAFSRNLPIKVNVIENGKMVLKEISPDSNDYFNMYIKQSAFLNDKIHSSVDSIMMGVQNNNSDSVNNDVDKLMGEIHSNVEGDDKSLINNHSTYSKSFSHIDLDIILKNASMGHKIFLSALLAKYGIDNIWDEVLSRLDSKKMSLDDFNKFVSNIKSMYDISEIKKYGIFNSSYKKLISKYPIEDELFVKLSSVMGYARNGFKKGLIAIIEKYGIDNIWMDIADSLNNKKISKEKYEEFVANLKKMFSKEECEKYKIFSNEHFKALSVGDILYDDGPQKIDVLSKDNIDHKTPPSKAKKTEPKHTQKVKSRKVASDSLKNKFFTKVDRAREWWGGLSPRTKGIIIASTIAVVGVGILVLNASTIKDLLDGANSSFNFSSFNSVTAPIDKITEQIQSNVSNIHNTINNIQSSVVNWDVIGEGHVGYKTAADAFNHMNGVTLNSFFGKEPSSGIIDVYNMVTGWMHLTKEQLNDPELLKTLSQDPNNVIHVKDAWFNLSDVLSEVIKGGKVL